MSLLTYDEIVAALRRGERMGDCVPPNVEATARAIVARRPRRPYHVVVRDEDGVVLDPTKLLMISEDDL